MGESFTIVPVGFIRSPVKTRKAAPRQGRGSGLAVVVDVLPEFGDSLDGLSEYSLIQVICFMHLARRDLKKVYPRHDPGNPLTGVFATRSPARPNPLAVYTAELIEVRGLEVKVRGVEAVDGTPVVDIKPHIHRLDD